MKCRAKVDKAGEGGWYVAKSSSGSSRRYIFWYALMVTSKGLIIGAGSQSGVIVVVGTIGDEPSHKWLDDGQRLWSDLRQ